MLAVTTRNLLRSRRFTPLMLRAWLQIRQQLYATPGMLRYTTAMGSLTEFYTLTLWDSHAAMFQFTSSGSHRRLMWMFSRWSQSFWSMRWLPTEERGSWDGLTLAATAPAGRRAGSSHWLEGSPAAELLAPFIDRQGRPDMRRPDPSPSGVVALVARRPLTSALDVYHLRQQLQPWRVAPGLLRLVLGFGKGETLLVSLWSQPAHETASQLLAALEQPGSSTWAALCAAGDYEIGHWNGLRVRQLAAAARGRTGPLAPSRR